MAGADEPNRARRCVAVVGAAYLVQGLVAGVGVQLVGALALRQTPLEQQVGILASGALPWLLKFAVALLLDLRPSWSLRMRGLVLTILQLGAAAALWMLSDAWQVEPGSGPATELPLQRIALIWVALNFAVALQDVCVDALALDTLDGRQAWTASAMGLGHALGFGLLAPLIVGVTIVEQGMSAGLRLPATWIALLAAVSLVGLWQPGTPTRKRDRPRDAAGAARARLDPRELQILLAVLLLFAALTFAANLTSALAGEFLLNHLGWDYAGYATYLPPTGAAAGLLAAIACGPIVARLGPARAGMLASIALGLTWIAFAGVHGLWHERATIIALAGCESALQTAMLVALHALALVLANRSPLPTTTFVAAMVALNLSRVVAPMLAPSWLALGWVGVFAACGVVQILAAIGLWPLREYKPGVNTGQQPPDVRPSA